MTESFTLSLFVYPQFLCTTFAASWLFVPVGGPGGLCVCCFVLLNRYWGIVMYGPGASSSRSYFTFCPSENSVALFYWPEDEED